jgi:hypothetical protein
MGALDEVNEVTEKEDKYSYTFPELSPALFTRFVVIVAEANARVAKKPGF